MPKETIRIHHCGLVAAALFVTGLVRLGPSDARAAGKLEPGLAVAFTAGGGDQGRPKDVVVSPNVSLYVPAGQPATPFLAGGRFSADWSGFVSSEIRDNYMFSAELNGELRLEINGVVVLEANAKDTNAASIKPVRLNKGANAFRLHFASPAEGDAFVRLFWSTKEFAPEPIAPSALSHEVTVEGQQADQLRLGRELFLELRCAKCHSGPPPVSGIPELAMDAPSFEGIGSRRNYEWMARWIGDPRALRPTARMPKLLNGPNAKNDAEAVAAFLASLTSEAAPREAKQPGADQAAAGKKLFEHSTASPATTHRAPPKTIRKKSHSARFDRSLPRALWRHLCGNRASITPGTGCPISGSRPMKPRS